MGNYGSGPYGAGLFGIGGSSGGYGAGLYGTGLYGTGGGTAGTYDAGTYDSATYGAGAPGTYDVGAYDTATYDTSPISGTGILGVPPIGLHGTGNTTSISVTGTGVLTFRGPTISGTGGQPSIVIVVPPQVGVNPPMAVVEVSFATNPTATPIWTDITPYVQGFSIRRGRQRELDQIGAGTLQLQLFAADRRFDPTYTAGPYYPNVLPMRRVRVRGTFNGINYHEYSGYIESWGEAWPSWQDTEITVTAADALKPITLANLNTTFPQQPSDQRVNAVLNNIGWTIGGPAWTLGTSTLGVNTVLAPTGDRIVTTGMSNIVTSTLTNTSALQHLQDVAVAESGMLFANVDGAVVFYGAPQLYSPATFASRATFGELEYPYVDIVMSFDDTNLANEIRVTAAGGIEQVATDATSQAQYYKRTLALSTVNASDTAAASLAQRLLAQWKQPGLQIESITLDGEVDPLNIYPQMLGRELGDRVTIRRRPPGDGTPIEQLSVIQGIDTTYTAEGGIWSTIWRLSPASTTAYWVLSDSTYSVLGTTTRLF